MTKGPFDFSGLPQLGGGLNTSTVVKATFKLTREWKAKKAYQEALEKFDHETAEAVAAAVRAGRRTDAILERAARRKEEQQERATLLASPPPLHGSARWAQPSDLGTALRDRSAFDDPRSILLGTVPREGGSGAEGFLHWDSDGHLMTLAPTRTGKSITTIVPNLLRYRGSCVVLDPKGELYALTSKWRATLGPVYRIAPFDDGTNPETAHFPRHGFNPLARIRSQADARALAELMFPRDPRAQAFFNNDAVTFLTAILLFVLTAAPPNRRNIGTIRQMTAKPTEVFRREVVQRMQQSPHLAVSEAANNVLGKSLGTGLPNLRDTLNSELGLWSDPALVRATDANDVDFAELKDQTATVYLTVPFELMKPYAPFLKVVLRAALDAMLRNPKVPDIPVLFVLDEFLSLGAFQEFRDAIRTHAGAGVRLWFFLQDLGSLQESYPGTGWWPFFNCAVKQYFGTDDIFTSELIGRDIGNQTVAHRAVSASANMSANLGPDGGSTGMNLSSGESINLFGRPLLTPDEVMAELSPWLPNKTRRAIIKLRDPGRPIRTWLVPYDQSARCMERIGAYLP